MSHDDHDHFQGPGRGHPWTGDRNRAEFPVSAWEVSTSIIFAIIIMIIVIAIIIIIIVTIKIIKIYDRNRITAERLISVRLHMEATWDSRSARNLMMFILLRTVMIQNDLLSTVTDPAYGGACRYSQ